MTRTNKFTPGPYVLHIHKDRGKWSHQIRTAKPVNGVSGLGSQVATLNEHAGGLENSYQVTGNGCLLAAAPDLLKYAEAVLDLVESEGRDTGVGDAFSDLRDAIDAARGVNVEPIITNDTAELLAGPTTDTVELVYRHRLGFTEIARATCTYRLTATQIVATVAGSGIFRFYRISGKPVKPSTGNCWQLAPGEHARLYKLHTNKKG